MFQLVHVHIYEIQMKGTPKRILTSKRSEQFLLAVSSAGARLAYTSFFTLTTLLCCPLLTESKGSHILPQPANHRLPRDLNQSHFSPRNLAVRCGNQVRQCLPGEPRKNIVTGKKPGDTGVLQSRLTTGQRLALNSLLGETE